MRGIGAGAGLAMLLAGQAAAAPEVPFAALGTALGAFVAVALGTAAPPPPEIGFADADGLRTLRYGAGAAAPALELVALYDDADRRILLPAGWTGSTPAELSVLVHELVHHLQASEGRRYACGGEREAEAYAVQARWLALFGETLEGAFGIDAMTRLVLTRCGG
jgi:hypothetical protein